MFLTRPDNVSPHHHPSSHCLPTPPKKNYGGDLKRRTDKKKKNGHTRKPRFMWTHGQTSNGQKEKRTDRPTDGHFLRKLFVEITNIPSGVI